ncbi:MAG: hypothetical protein WBA17_00615, partial [Saprospiraceae bacterium]
MSFSPSMLSVVLFLLVCCGCGGENNPATDSPAATAAGEDSSDQPDRSDSRGDTLSATAGETTNGKTTGRKKRTTNALQPEKPSQDYIDRLIKRMEPRIVLSEAQVAQVREIATEYDLEELRKKESKAERRKLIKRLKAEVLTEEQREAVSFW